MVKLTDPSLGQHEGFAPVVKEVLSAVLTSGTKVFNCFCSVSRLTPPQARDALSGRIASPTLKVMSLSSDGSINGLFDPTSPNEILIDAEIAQRCAGLRSDPRYRQLIEATILHETVHWAEHRSGGVDNSIEQGWRFEDCAYQPPVVRPWLADAAPACGMARACSELLNAGSPPRGDPPQLVKGVPMADPGGSVWPVITTEPNGRTVSYRNVFGRDVGDPGRAFAVRKKPTNRESIVSDNHNPGVDLFAKVGDGVVAAEDGVVVANQPFFEQTMAMLVLTSRRFVTVYGGLVPGSSRTLKAGDGIRAGAVLGQVGGTSRGAALHFGIYTQETRALQPWIWDSPRPTNLLNPTRYLLTI